MSVQGKPTDFLSRAEIADLRKLSPWRSAWMIAHCWGVIFGTWVFAVLFPHPLVVLIAIPIVGCRQLGLGILGHDGAHHLLFKSRALNDWVCQWLFNRPLLGASIVPYRNYHLMHHRYTQQANDPDLKLSSPFPITRASFRRKVLRDLTGRTALNQHATAIRAVLGSQDDSVWVRAGRGLRRYGPNIAINAAFLGGFAAAGHWYLYLLLWVVPDITWRALISRVRNIGEHAAVPDNDDRLRNTRTTRAGWLARAFVAPYFVNYHLEHHLLVSCPCHRLPHMHRLLIEKGFAPRMELKSNYVAMLAHATSKPVAVPA